MSRTRNKPPDENSAKVYEDAIARWTANEGSGATGTEHDPLLRFCASQEWMRRIRVRVADMADTPASDGRAVNVRSEGENRYWRSATSTWRFAR